MCLSDLKKKIKVWKLSANAAVIEESLKLEFNNNFYIFFSH